MNGSDTPGHGPVFAAVESAQEGLGHAAHQGASEGYDYVGSVCVVVGVYGEQGPVYAPHYAWCVYVGYGLGPYCHVGQVAEYGHGTVYAVRGRVLAGYYKNTPARSFGGQLFHDARRKGGCRVNGLHYALRTHDGTLCGQRVGAMDVDMHRPVTARDGCEIRVIGNAVGVPAERLRLGSEIGYVEGGLDIIGQRLALAQGLAVVLVYPFRGSVGGDDNQGYPLVIRLGDRRGIVEQGGA